MSTKDVYFYQMEIFREENNCLDKKREYLNKNKILEIYKNKILVDENLVNDSLVAKEVPYQQTLEVIDFNNKYLFGRLGKAKGSTFVQLRNKTTLKTSEVAKNKTQNIEIYTYFYLDFETAIITFIDTLFAPRITILNNLINRYAEDNTLKTKVFPILREDLVQIINEKRVISNIQFSVALPSDNILDMTGIGLSRKEFDKIYKDNLKTRKVTIKLIAVNSQSILQGIQASKIADFISSIFNESQGDVNEFKIKTKDNNEQLKEYDILKKRITEKVKMEYSNEQEILTKLQKVYQGKKNQLLNYTRSNN